MTDAHSPSATSRPSAATLQRLLGYLASDPGNLTLRADVFQTALELGERSTAQQQITWVLSRHPADFGWRHRLAVLDMAEREWTEARLILQSLLDEGQTDPVISFNLAYVEFSTGLLVESIERLRRLLDGQQAPPPGVLPLLLRCLHRLGRVDEGLALLHEQLASRSVVPEALGVGSLLAVDANQLTQACAWAEQALASDPQQHEALVSRATAALGEGDGRRALAHLETALRRHPEDGRTLSTTGMAYLLGGDLDAARKAFVQAVSLIPSHIGTWHGLGWCEVLRQDLPAAGRAFEAALALDPNFGESHGGLAVVQAMSGQMGPAAESIRRALGLDSAGLSVRFAQAVLSGEAKDSERFARLVRRTFGERRASNGRSLADLVLGRRS